MRPPLRGVVRGNDDAEFACPSCFVVREELDLAPRALEDRSIEARFLGHGCSRLRGGAAGTGGHVLDFKVLEDEERRCAGHDPMTRLMRKVLAHIGRVERRSGDA